MFRLGADLPCPQPPPYCQQPETLLQGPDDQPANQPDQPDEPQQPDSGAEQQPDQSSIGQSLKFSGKILRNEIVSCCAA